jgi:putative transposase
MADGASFEAEEIPSGSFGAAIDDHAQKRRWLAEVGSHLTTLNLESGSLGTILEMLDGSPARNVGVHALRNVISRFPTVKNPIPVWLESESCEQLLAFELEADESVKWYATQVPCRGVRRGSHVSQMTADFLVVGERSVTIVEAKPESELERLAREKPNEWVKDSTGWRRPSVEGWAVDRGMSYQIWSPPSPFGLYLRNMNHVWMSSTESAISGREKWLFGRLRAELADASRSIDELKAQIPTFNEHIATLALRQRIAFGWMRSASLDDPAVFHLFLHEGQANETDLRRLSALARDLEPLDARHALVSASPKAFACAVRRHQIIYSAEVPRGMRALETTVRAVEADGGDTLTACLPNFAACGNRMRRLNARQISVIDNEVRFGWLQGKTSSQLEAWHNIKNACKAEGLPSVSKTTVRRALSRSSSQTRALSTGGKRAFQAERESVDPARRTLAPMAVGARLHIDSSKFDKRVAPDLLPRLGFEAPTFYVGVDACSKRPVAHSLVFGRARTDGLAILIRRYVRLHGRLPREIFLDRGPENRSHWLIGFCEERRIRLMWPPTAGSSWNSLPENVIGRVNSSLAHYGPGSTLPDQRGRGVDGAFKSKRTARMMFGAVVKELEHCLYEDISNQPLSDGGTPLAREEAALAAFGHVGYRCLFDDWFCVQTAVPISLCAIDMRRGVRLTEGTFVSDTLFARAKAAKALAMRLDCVNPTKLYVQFPTGWVVARSAQAQISASLTEDQKLFELLYGAMLRAESEEARDQQTSKRFDRLQAAIAQLPDTVGLAEPEKNDNAQLEDDSFEHYDLDGLASFDREGD